MLEIYGLAERLLLAIGGDQRGNRKKAAQRLGIRESVLGGWLKEGKDGRRKAPSAEHLKNIHEKLGVDLNWLISGEGRMHAAARRVAERPATYEALASSDDRDIDKVLSVWKRIPESKRPDVLKVLEALAEKGAVANRKPKP